MSNIFDFAIVGGGLSGSAIALMLSKHGSVVQVEGVDDYAGSNIPAGLFNPIMTRQGKRVYRASQALESLEHLLENTVDKGVLLSKGIIRPAQTEKQRKAFIRSARENSDLCLWSERDDLVEDHPRVHAPFGALKIHAGGAIHIPRYCESLKYAATERGAVRVSGKVNNIETSRRNAAVSISGSKHADHIKAMHVILCVGMGYRQFPSLASLNLHAIKGQVITLEKPQGFGTVPSLSGSGYVIDNGKTIVAGSSYQHAFAALEPEIGVSHDIQKKITRMCPDLGNLRIIEHHAGVRLTVPRSYLPTIGPIDTEKRVWFVGGLGSKGLLMSAWISGQILDLITGKQDIPEQLGLTFMS